MFCIFRYELNPIQNSPDILRKFRIIPHNGSLFTNEKLDREQNNSYRLQITARDMGTPSHTASVQIVVDVLDQV